MQFRTRLLLFRLKIEIDREECSNLWKVIIKITCPQNFWTGQEVSYVRTAQNNKIFKNDEF